MVFDSSNCGLHGIYRLEITKLLGRFYSRIIFKIIFINHRRFENFSSLKFIFPVSCKGISSINWAVDSVRKPTVMANLSWIIFLQKNRLNPYVQMQNTFSQCICIDVRLEFWKISNLAMFSSRVRISTSEWLKGPTRLQEELF